MSRAAESAASRVARLVAEDVRSMSAYHVAEAQGLVKLDAMENPYTWPESLKDEWLARLRQVDVNRYPDPRARPLKEALRSALRLPAELEILLGNGSDELIQLLVLGIGGPGSVVLAPDPSFAMYGLLTRVIGRRFVSPRLDAEDFALDVEAMRAAIREHDPALIFLAYPNNPTGNLFDADAIAEIVAESRGVVVIDEAYAPFARRSFVDELAAWPNVLLLRTVSKLGLAGLRLGILAGSREWLAELDKLRLPYNLNVLTQVSAEFALRHGDVFEEQTQRIIEDRRKLHERLAQIPGITVWQSHANFLLVRSLEVPGSTVVRRLRERGVLVKDLHGSSALLADCMRVTVGRPEENEAFLRALAAALA